MSRRVLVLGAEGFIGRHVVQALAASDWTLPIAASRHPRAASGDSLDRVRLDATDEAALYHALQNVDTVVNCVAGSPQTIVTGARALIRAAAGCAPPPSVVHLSSMAVYGPVTGTVAESAPLLGSEPYALAKIEAERACAGYPAAVVLRPGIVYGPGGTQWTGRIGYWLQAHRLGDLGPAGDGYCNLVYVGDVVAAILQAARQPGLNGQTFNLGLPDPPTWNDYFIRFARALGATPVTRISGARLRLETRMLAPPLKIAELLCKRMGAASTWLPAPIPPSLLRLCQQEIRLNVGRAEKMLALRWTSLEEALTRSADWFKQSA